MRKLKLINQRFGRLLVTAQVQSKNGKTYWACKCDCGNITNVASTNLTGGLIRSCSCLKQEALMKRNITHNLSKTRIYGIWIAMKKRCSSKNNQDYKLYGSRGITVCEEWKTSFQSFYDWSMQNGYKEGLSIDRINNDGNYEPSNCRWTTMLVQANNQRTNVLYTINGITKTRAEWCREYNMKYDLVEGRLHRGWDIIKALTTPVKKASK